MDKKKIITLVVVAVVAGGIGFFGGTKFSQAKAKTAQAAFRGGAGGAAFAGRRGANSQNGGGFTGGQIISKDDKSITIKTMDGGSKIVFLAGSTQISKSVSGTSADLNNGENVVVTGTANSDGSVTAQNIQIRPAMPPATPNQ